jgi:calcineurin-like phosphoesterase family protein
MIYLTSDLHFNHDRDFIYKPRGFNSVQDMNEALVKNWNDTVSDCDIVYVLGDFFLGQDFDYIKDTINKLNGNIYLILGNHDTSAKELIYYMTPKILSIYYSTIIVYKKRQFYLSHYPTMTADLQTNPDKAIYNLFGHTHSKDKFYMNSPYNYNVAVDANDNRPISIDNIFIAIQDKIKENSMKGV